MQLGNICQFYKINRQRNFPDHARIRCNLQELIQESNNAALNAKVWTRIPHRCPLRAHCCVFVEAVL